MWDESYYKNNINIMMNKEINKQLVDSAAIVLCEWNQRTHRHKKQQCNSIQFEQTEERKHAVL